MRTLFLAPQRTDVKSEFLVKNKVDEQIQSGIKTSRPYSWLRYAILDRGNQDTEDRQTVGNRYQNSRQRRHNETRPDLENPAILIFRVGRAFPR